MNIGHFGGLAWNTRKWKGDFQDWWQTGFCNDSNTSKPHLEGVWGLVWGMELDLLKIHVVGLGCKKRKDGFG